MSEPIIVDMDRIPEDDKPKDWIIRLSRRDIEKFYFVDKRWCINARRSSAIRTTKEIATAYAKAINKYHKELTSKVMRFDAPIANRPVTESVKAAAIAVLLAAVAVLTAHAETTTYRTASGRTVATSTTTTGSTTTTWRNASGNAVLTRTDGSGGTGVYRDRSGSIVATRKQAGGQTVYRDRSGSITATSSTNGKTTTWRDRSGHIIGTETRGSDGRTVYRDASGRITGSKR